MKWIAGTLIALILGTVLQLGFLVYAMYVLLGIQVEGLFLRSRR
jgi:hypothetical protein